MLTVLNDVLSNVVGLGSSVMYSSAMTKRQSSVLKERVALSSVYRSSLKMISEISPNCWFLPVVIL
jgi:hypothetical protein